MYLASVNVPTPTFNYGKEIHAPTEGTGTGREPVPESDVQKPEDRTTDIKSDTGNSRVSLPHMRTVASDDKSET